jgi:hypothetical protein
MVSYCQRITKNGCGFVERNAMLAQVFYRFLFVPFEIHIFLYRIITNEMDSPYLDGIAMCQSGVSQQPLNDRGSPHEYYNDWHRFGEDGR